MKKLFLSSVFVSLCSSPILADIASIGPLGTSTYNYADKNYVYFSTCDEYAILPRDIQNGRTFCRDYHRASLETTKKVIRMMLKNNHKILTLTGLNETQQKIYLKNQVQNQKELDDLKIKIKNLINNREYYQRDDLNDEFNRLSTIAQVNEVVENGIDHYISSLQENKVHHLNFEDTQNTFAFKINNELESKVFDYIIDRKKFYEYSCGMTGSLINRMADCSYESYNIFTNGRVITRIGTQPVLYHVTELNYLLYPLNKIVGLSIGGYEELDTYQTMNYKSANKECISLFTNNSDLNNLVFRLPSLNEAIILFKLNRIFVQGEFSTGIWLNTGEVLEFDSTGDYKIKRYEKHARAVCVSEL